MLEHNLRRGPKELSVMVIIPKVPFKLTDVGYNHHAKIHCHGMYKLPKIVTFSLNFVPLSISFKSAPVTMQATSNLQSLINHERTKDIKAVITLFNQVISWHFHFHFSLTVKTSNNHNISEKVHILTKNIIAAFVPFRCMNSSRRQCRMISLEMPGSMRNLLEFQKTLFCSTLTKPRCSRTNNSSSVCTPHKIRWVITSYYWFS